MHARAPTSHYAHERASSTDGHGPDLARPRATTCPHWPSPNRRWLATTCPHWLSLALSLAEGHWLPLAYTRDFRSCTSEPEVVGGYHWLSTTGSHRSLSCTSTSYPPRPVTAATHRHPPHRHHQQRRHHHQRRLPRPATPQDTGTRLVRHSSPHTRHIHTVLHPTAHSHRTAHPRHHQHQHQHQPWPRRRHHRPHACPRACPNSSRL
mmetsp:Transcript_5854/g.13575  ORF Transcript_5854/g.13575 Transcript_5854/m.13575 type:complete len:207 (-) Transcript_5854:97-717(-)